MLLSPNSRGGRGASTSGIRDNSPTASSGGTNMTTSDIDKIDSEMKSVIENLEKSISRLKGKSNDDKRLERCTQLIKRFSGLLESLKLDVATMDDSNPDKKVWKEKLAEHENRINELKVAFNDKRREVEKKILLKSSQGEKLKNLSGDEDVTQLDKQQALHVGDVLLDKAEKSLARTKKLVVESEQIGISTLQKMETQNEQMEKIYEDFDEIDGNLARSKRILGHIAQSAVNDRCIQVLAVLVFIAIVVVLVQHFTGDKSSSDSSTTAAPQRLRRLMETIVNGEGGNGIVRVLLEEN